ncbi:MAG: hypothetical protein PF436_02320 [Prolixibacteraceae bacterium]|jgi:Spy/CpxP family protein refolding chaperone|nr:hypothetical protein [Prolixibacteraceae bacterium]
MRPTIKSILFLLVLLLLGANIATVITYRNHLKSEQNLSGNSNSEKITIPDQQIGRFFRDTLNLDINQQQKFRTYRREYHQNANQILNELNAIRFEMAGILKYSQPDNERLDSLAIMLGEKHTQLKQETFNYYFNLQNELNPDQQEKLSVIFESMLYNDQKPHSQNQGNRGKRNGRKNRSR